MKALRVHELGEPEQVMVLEDRPEPEVRPGDVRLRVHAASLNFEDGVIGATLLKSVLAEIAKVYEALKATAGG